MDGPSVIEKVRKRMERWAGYSLYQSIFRQAAIKEGIDASYREIDHCMRKLSVKFRLYYQRCLPLTFYTALGTCRSVP